MRKYLITTIDKNGKEFKSYYDVYNSKQQLSAKKYCEQLEKDELKTIVSATYKECKKVYQFIEQHFTKDLYSGADYMLSTSPFNQGRCYEKFEDALNAARMRKDRLIEQGETFDYEDIFDEKEKKSYWVGQGFNHYSPKLGVRIIISVQEMFIIP